MTGIHIRNGGGQPGTETNQYGIYVEALTAGTNNYGIFINTPTGTIADAIHAVGGRTFLGGNLVVEGGTITVSAAATDIVVKAATAAALDITDGTGTYYTLDTRQTTPGMIAHLWDLRDFTFASGTGSFASGYRWAAFVLNYTGNTTVTSLVFSHHMEQQLIAGAEALTVNQATNMKIEPTIASTNITLINSSAIQIINATIGTPTNVHGILIETLTDGSTNYAVTVGNSDANQNLIHVGVTGDPIFSWDEAGDRFAMNKGLNFTAGTLTAPTIAGVTSFTASGNLDIGAFDFRAATITADGLTATRVIFAGASGLLSDDADLTFAGSTLAIGVATSTTGILTMAGATSGVVSVTVGATAGTWTMVLPAAVGGAGEQLTDAAGNGITSWAAASSLREYKDVSQLMPQSHDALDRLLNTRVYSFHYKAGMGTQDSETEYWGVMADEAPWAMHYGGRVVNPVSTFGHTVLAIQALAEDLERLREQVVSLGGEPEV